MLGYTRHSLVVRTQALKLRAAWGQLSGSPFLGWKTLRKVTLISLRFSVSVKTRVISNLYTLLLMGTSTLQSKPPSYLCFPTVETEAP